MTFPVLLGLHEPTLWLHSYLAEILMLGERCPVCTEWLPMLLRTQPTAGAPSCMGTPGHLPFKWLQLGLVYTHPG